MVCVQPKGKYTGYATFFEFDFCLIDIKVR